MFQPSRLFTVPLMLTALAVLLGFSSFQDLRGVPEIPTVDAHGGAGSNPGDLLGYAWSSTFGWVSFSCENDASCAAGNWGVTVDAHGAAPTGDLSGYAWSSTLGWIDFGNPNLTGCPGGSVAASYNLATKKLTGYARVVSLAPPAAAAAAGGADGCINLDPGGAVPAGDAVQLKTLVSGPSRTDYFDGYAWDASLPAAGLPLVGIGWLDFCVTAPSDCAHLRTALSSGAGDPWLRVNGGVAPVTVASGDTVTISWGSDPTMTSCAVVLGAASGFAVVGGNTSGTDVTNALVASDNFRISCTDGTTTYFSNTVPVTISAGPAPKACNNGVDDDGDGSSDAADPGCLNSSGVYDPNDDDERDVSGVFTVTPIRVRTGGEVDADWNVTGGGATVCDLEQSGKAPAVIYSGPATGGASQFANIVVANASQTLFTLKCKTVAAGPVVLTKSVRVILTPTVRPDTKNP